MSVLRCFVFLSFLLLVVGSAFTQNADSTARAVDSMHHPAALSKTGDSLMTTALIINADSLLKDSLLKKSLADALWLSVAMRYEDQRFIRLGYRQNKFFGFTAAPILITSNKKIFVGKELLFYVLVALLLIFAAIKYSFPKYMMDLFRVAFRTTMKQRQLGEQMIQSPIPSLFLNIFFVVSTGLYLDFLLHRFAGAATYNFWLLYAYCSIGLVVIYLIKFISLKFFGWLFNISPTTDGYIFIVFVINKIIGLYLLPFLILLAFTDGDVYQVALALSYIGVICLLVCRFMLSYGLIRGQLRVNPFHFILYLCAFEIIPLIIIYRALLRWF